MLAKTLINVPNPSLLSHQLTLRARIVDQILKIDAQDLPQYKKGGSVVRNTYYWALKSISCYARREQDWEFDPEVWVALGRMLLFFTESGYLGVSETLLEFSVEEPIPEPLRLVSTWR